MKVRVLTSVHPEGFSKQSRVLAKYITLEPASMPEVGDNFFKREVVKVRTHESEDLDAVIELEDDFIPDENFDEHLTELQEEDWKEYPF